MRLLFLERDIDKALRRMALEEEKNLTETVNDMGHSDIAVTLNVYTHVGLEDAEKELQKM